MKVTVRGTREAQKLLESLSGRELQNRTRRATRRGAAIGRKALRAEASRRSDLPGTFRKMATRGHRTPVGTSTGPTSLLLNIFEGGAKRHSIGASGQMLSNFDKRREGGAGFRRGFFLARGPVDHPGMAARPFIGPVFEREQDAMSEAAMDEYLRDLR